MKSALTVALIVVLGCAILDAARPQLCQEIKELLEAYKNSPMASMVSAIPTPLCYEKKPGQFYELQCHKSGLCMCVDRAKGHPSGKNETANCELHNCISKRIRTQVSCATCELPACDLNGFYEPKVEFNSTTSKCLDKNNGSFTKFVDHKKRC